MKQEEIVKQLTDQQLKQVVYQSQLLFLGIGIILSFIIYRNLRFLSEIISFNLSEIGFYGVVIALFLVSIEILLYFFVPKKYFDDGGINEKLFRNQSVIAIFFIALTVAICEEYLFRAVIQTTFGYFFASSLFVIVHFRYLKKPVLLLGIIITSFLIGFLFEITNNLLVVISFHFTVDFILGLFIRLLHWGEENGNGAKGESS